MMRRLLVVALLGAGMALAGMIAASAQAPSREIQFENRCRKPVRLLIHHRDTYSNPHHPHGWWEYAPFEGPSTLAVDGRRLTQLTDQNLYYYAETLDGGSLWEGNETTTQWQGVTYGLRRATLVATGGRVLFYITCS